MSHLAPRPEPGKEGREEPALVRKLRDRREEHRKRGKIYRAAFVVAGFVVLLAGLAMLLLPGPALIVIPIGLAILSLEFSWAGALLERALDRAEAAKKSATDASGAQKILVACATVAGVAAVLAWGVLGDIPLLPL